MNTKFNSDFVAIYPEIIHGNPAEANTVVRYILNEVGMMGTMGVRGPESYPDTDKIFVFSKLFNTFGVDEDHLMFLPVINLHEFYDQKKKRTNTCFFVGKGQNTQKHPEDAIEVSRVTAGDQAHLANVLNRCEVMYGYDPVSAMYDIARLCGCRVVILPSKYSKKEFSKYELSENGLSFDKDTSKLDTQLFLETYRSMRDSFSDKIDRFIELTQ